MLDDREEESFLYFLSRFRGKTLTVHGLSFALFLIFGIIAYGQSNIRLALGGFTLPTLGLVASHLGIKKFLRQLNNGVVVLNQSDNSIGANTQLSALTGLPITYLQNGTSTQ